VGLDLTWTCHVCGKVRPDDKISVYHRIITHDIIDITENIRYCNDNPDCVEGAKTKTFVGDNE
jgi:hypothetical protein